MMTNASCMVLAVCTGEGFCERGMKSNKELPRMHDECCTSLQPQKYKVSERAGSQHDNRPDCSLPLLKNTNCCATGLV